MEREIGPHAAYGSVYAINPAIIIFAVPLLQAWLADADAYQCVIVGTALTTLAPMCLARPVRAWWYATLCTLSSVAGGLLGYLIGKLAFHWIESWVMGSGYASAFTQAVEAFETYGFWYILLAGFSPIPYKVCTISAGALGMPFLPFVLASAVGRGGRFYLVAGLLSWGGARIEKRIRSWVEGIGWGLVVVTVIVIGYLMARG